MSEDSYQHNCGHQEQIIFLQEKLSQVHSKLIQQIEITKEKQLEIIALKKSHKNRTTDNNQFDSASSQASKDQKIWLLEENLEAMRKKMMEEIKQKKEIKKKMVQQSIKYQNDLKQAKQQFEGLQILYLKLLESANHPEKKVGQLTGSDKNEIKSIKAVDKKQVQLRYFQKENHVDNSKFKKQKLQIEVKSQQNHSSDTQDRDRVLRQIQEVKNTFRRQNQLKTPNSTKQATEKQIHKIKCRNIDS